MSQVAQRSGMVLRGEGNLWPFWWCNWVPKQQIREDVFHTSDSWNCLWIWSLQLVKSGAFLFAARNASLGKPDWGVAVLSAWGIPLRYCIPQRHSTATKIIRLGWQTTNIHPQHPILWSFVTNVSQFLIEESMILSSAPHTKSTS